MNNLEKYIGVGLVALTAQTGCVVERGETTTGGRYDRVDAGYADAGYQDSGLLDTGVTSDVTPGEVDSGNGNIECVNNYSQEIQRVIHAFMDRTNSANLLPLSGFGQPVLQFSANYDATPYVIQPVTTETGHLIRGGVDLDNEQAAVGVANYDNDSQDYTDRQFLEVAYNGQTPKAARTYIEYGKVVAGTAYDRMVQINQADDLGGACDVVLQDTYDAILDEIVLCENPCEELLDALSTRVVSVINQAN